MSIFRRLLLRKVTSHQSVPVIDIQLATISSSRVLWQSIEAYYIIGYYSSSTNSASPSLRYPPARVISTTSMATNNTVVIPLYELPRYVAYSHWGSAGNFPIAHVGRISLDRQAAATGIALRNISSAINYIFDLESIADSLGTSWYNGGDPAFFFRIDGSGYGQIVGSDDYQVLQNYLNNL